YFTLFRTHIHIRRDYKNTQRLHLPTAHIQQRLQQIFFAWAVYGFLRANVLKWACFHPIFYQ
ncbi:hypothetical protein, partial [Bartonella henselae]|uniref:hypothetical protein n=1 Tax=Bartonella henselae TaxID=38323 RepID=UPI001AECE78A